MAKLYFKYGAMGSSKTAQALITKFNYEERGMHVWLIKPQTDSRDGADIVRSRIGLEAHAWVAAPETDILRAYAARADKTDVIIVDECQFFTPAQIDAFRTQLFPGSRRLFEIADSVTEIKTVCSCGAKAIVNARLDKKGRVVTQGSQVFLGGNDSYIAMCYHCYQKAIATQEAQK